MPARNGSVGSRSDLYTDQIAFIFCNGDTDWTLDDEISTDDQTLRIFKQRQLIPTYSAAKIFLLLDSFEMSDRQKAVVPASGGSTQYKLTCVGKERICFKVKVKPRLYDIYKARLSYFTVNVGVYKALRLAAALKKRRKNML
uniref:Crinkler (CRN) n=1 Tax=Ascaris lumbricoides TaxID=6252 RepID=A0A0M3HYS5_ASCLU